jgi:hypothetical protein
MPHTTHTTHIISHRTQHTTGSQQSKEKRGEVPLEYSFATTCDTATLTLGT